MSKRRKRHNPEQIVRKLRDADAERWQRSGFHPAESRSQ